MRPVDMSKINEDDFLQPIDPRFEKVYGYNPIKEYKEKLRKKENWKDDREIGLKIKVKKGILKPWQMRDSIKYARERGIE